MADLVVIVPSRGRPEAALALVQALAGTCTAKTRLLFAVDESDSCAHQYGEATGVLSAAHHLIVNVLYCPSTNMVGALNMAAVNAATYGGEFAVGFMGDDHRPRTVGWDETYLGALRELGTGIVYGNDGLQGPNIPTQVAMTSDIVRALGYMAPPELTHLFVDNFWKTLGQKAGCLRYLPDVLIEHMHPIAGKAKWDDGYHRVNAPAMYQRDGQAFRQWMATRMTGDVEKVKALRSAVV